MSEPLQREVLEALATALEPHARADGLVRQPVADALVWEKVGADARDGERDRIVVRAEAWPGGGVRVTGEVRSSQRDAVEPLGAFGIAQRHGPGAGAVTPGWDVTCADDLTRVIGELEALVAGQVIPWLDEPVPLRGSLSDGPLLGGLLLPTRRARKPVDR